MALTLCVIRQEQSVTPNAKPRTGNAGSTLAPMETDAVPDGFIRTTFLEHYSEAIKKVRRDNSLVRAYDRTYMGSMLNKVIDIVEELKKKEGKVGAKYTERKRTNVNLTKEDFKRFTLKEAKKVANYPNKREYWDPLY